ncbi:aminotransferase class IV [Maribacter sp. ACAM166]|uniref:aminotransferase class IV n=1 Tax=Maribacter sp. ACAM166 TaxID=2508996 RepID=UPI0010FE0000|nr:aminotransferase class IV [Maribacter sp. ACAM166]TLP78803.1 hypothetical protein ES765_12210 [Maribacter sp. ACAM166]
MYPLFESVCIQNGQIQNGQYHEFRFLTSYFEHFGFEPKYSLLNNLTLPKLDSSLKLKLRIGYHETGIEWTISEYKNKIPTSLRLLQDDSIDYALKYADRSDLDKIYKKRDGADDVLLIKNGHITDASYSNILFTDGSQIATPSTPLLHGTCRARLIAENKVQEVQITLKSIKQFQSFQLINALNDFDENRWVTIQNSIID